MNILRKIMFVNTICACRSPISPLILSFGEQGMQKRTNLYSNLLNFGLKVSLLSSNIDRNPEGMRTLFIQKFPWRKIKN